MVNRTVATKLTEEEHKKMGLAELLLTISSKKQNEVTIDGE